MHSRVRTALAFLVADALVSTVPGLAGPLRWNGPLTQAQVVARARESFVARLAALKAEVAAARARSMRAQALPQVSFSETTMTSTLTQLGTPAARQTYGSLNASVPLFAPQAWAAARAAGSQAWAARATTAMVINQAVSDAVQVYNAAALARAVVQQRAIDVRDQRSHLAFTEERVRAGAAPRYLIARDEAALAQAQQSEEDARAGAVRATHALEVLLDFNIASNPVITLRPPSLTFAPNAAVLERRAYAQRPDVVAAERSLLAARQRITSARDGYLPTISATAQTYNGTSNPPLGNAGSQVGISASLPLFDGGSRSADVRRAQLDYDRTRIELHRIRLQAQADVLNAVRDVQAAQRNVVTAHSELRNAKVDVRITELRARAGKGIELDVLDALATLANARENVLRATARYDDSLAALHRAVGDYAPTSY
ncbi:MAG: TolC family protein [Vulcanimicrobiaceae bacterium]